MMIKRGDPSSKKSPAKAHGISPGETDVSLISPCGDHSNIQTVASDIRKTIEPDIAMNWEIILRAVYQHKKKIPLLLKAGMGMEILDQINSGIETVPDQFKLRIAVWNGIIFNAVGIWAVSGFHRPLEQMAAELTEITMHLYDSEVAAAFDPHI